MFRKPKLTLLAALLLIATANAATIAILEITLSSDEEMDLTIDETKFLTDELRRQATIILPKEHTVWTREEIISLVPQTAENLSTVIDIGRAIKSDYVTQGFIGKLGNLFTLTIEIYSTSDGKLLNYFVKETPDLKGLLDVIRENSPNLFAKIPTEPKKTKTSFWIALSLDILGTGAIGLGIYNNAKSIEYYNKSKELREAVPNDEAEYQKNQTAYKTEYKKVSKAEKTRNIFYATGGILLSSGLVIHIWF